MSLSRKTRLYAFICSPVLFFAGCVLIQSGHVKFPEEFNYFAYLGTIFIFLSGAMFSEFSPEIIK